MHKKVIACAINDHIFKQMWSNSVNSSISLCQALPATFDFGSSGEEKTGRPAPHDTFLPC